jgi:hypothetical protein
VIPPNREQPQPSSIRAISAAGDDRTGSCPPNPSGPVDDSTTPNLYFLHSCTTEDPRAPSDRAIRRDRRHQANTLISDASVRTTNAGRILLRALLPHVGPDVDWESLADDLPPHCLEAVAALAASCAEDWRLLSERIAQRRSTGYDTSEEIG